MKRVWTLLIPLALASCGSLNTAPTPPAGDLLSVPTTLNVNGQVVRANATTRLSRSEFRVRMNLQSTQTRLPAVNFTNLYVVTSQGVWKSNQTLTTRIPCGARRCLQGTASSTPGGFELGENVQVIAQLSSPTGQTYWLRDPESRITAEKH